ncbi:H2.0-like homeobox protein isoform X1 [Haliotis rufescens]|uniref:H2.0-like homeobox protein isoform X1 n=1 Tax=Haliotis rufescens TaxID=6454 RepID=UPI00201F1CAA|nr:H2.0-like homeobox protein isoform X1 [Haliotis rufescens]
MPRATKENRSWRTRKRMYLSNCISCVPGGAAFWPHLTGDSVTGLIKKGHSFNISEILHPNSGTITHHYSTPVFTYGMSPRTSSPPPTSSSGLAPLQALCASGMSAFTARGSGEQGRGQSDSSTSNQLKFGITRILSDDFGKDKSEKASSPKRSPPTSPARPHLCPCNSVTCTPGHYPQMMYPSSLSAVHALQPPQYPMSAGSDALPGELFSWPYSILSADNGTSGQPKRKRSWSRAVFSNLQRKGLEKRFEVQKYVTKPDRRQLAAMLGLTDAQVKVWFQNRRMKWRHAQQQKAKDDEGSPDGETGSKEGEERALDKVDIEADSEEESDECDKEEEISIDSGVEETDVPCSMVSQEESAN